MRWPKLIPELWRRMRAAKRAEVPTQDEAPAAAPHLALGRRGEALAAEYLGQAGYHLVGSNFEIPVGRNSRGAVIRAEIDLIAYDKSILCFVEVKTRTSDWFAPPEANVDLRKQRQIARAARVYRRLLGLNGVPYRYDVVSVIIPAPGEDESRTRARFTLLRNFWTEEKFRKRRWADESRW